MLGCSTQMIGSGLASLPMPLSMVAVMALSERTGITASAGSAWRSGSRVGRCWRSQFAESSTIGASCCPE